MGGEKIYRESGGFDRQTYRAVGITRGGIKVLEKIGGANANLPQYSNTPGTVYAVLRPDGKPKQIMFYGSNRKQYKRIDLDHDHPPKKGVHIQSFTGEGTRYKLSKKEKSIVKDFYAYYKGVSK